MKSRANQSHFTSQLMIVEMDKASATSRGPVPRWRLASVP